MTDLVLTGIGIATPIGIGRDEFASALFEGRSSFGVMQRPGRQGFIGAELPELSLPERFSRRDLRTATLSGKAALLTLSECWADAALDDVDPTRVGLIVGGSNLQQRESFELVERYRERMEYLPPTYGFMFLDTDLAALSTAHFSIRGQAYTVGGASASGNLAIIEAARLVRSGEVDVCLALGALADLSAAECRALRSLGAMGSERFADEPSRACRPFDVLSDGFIYGEACGVVAVETRDHADRRGADCYASLTGWALCVDGNRNPDPSLEGELEAVGHALEMAGTLPGDIDYVNPHGTGSVIGDRTEAEAIVRGGLSSALVNATKSLTGHALSASGVVEAIAILVQMSRGLLHPSRNLDEPIADLNWVGATAVEHDTARALSISLGFGGINTAICLERSGSRRL